MVSLSSFCRCNFPGVLLAIEAYKCLLKTDGVIGIPSRAMLANRKRKRSFHLAMDISSPIVDVMLTLTLKCFCMLPQLYLSTK